MSRFLDNVSGKHLRQKRIGAFLLDDSNFPVAPKIAVAGLLCLCSPLGIGKALYDGNIRPFVGLEDCANITRLALLEPFLALVSFLGARARGLLLRDAQRRIPVRARVLEGEHGANRSRRACPPRGEHRILRGALEPGGWGGWWSLWSNVLAWRP